MKMHNALLGMAVFVLTLPLYAQDAVERVVIPPLKNVEIKGFYTSAEHFNTYKGSYDLSNGKELVLRRKNTRMYARIGSQSEHEIVRTGRNAFTALDRTMHIALKVDTLGDLSGSMTYVDEDMVAAGQSPETAIITTAMR
jgi:hypothetical protein